VTGTIARTATNVRAGARGPLSGVFHAGFLLIFILIAAPLAGYIPLAALAGVLAVVAWDMVEKQAFMTLLRSSWGDALVLLATFLLTVFRDLTEGIVVGFALGSLLFIHRMAETAEVELGLDFAPEDMADDVNGGRGEYDAALATDAEVMVYRIKGAFFFGAASTVGAVLDRIGDHQRVFVIDFSAVPMMDSTAASVIQGFAAKARKRDARVFLTGTSPAVRRVLSDHGVRQPAMRFRGTIEEAVAEARGVAEGNPGPV
jgi:SulP family sulfate permease